MKKIERRIALVCPDCNYIFPFIPSVIKMKEGTEVFCGCSGGKWTKVKSGWKWVKN
jgi:hypothetical protein